jgi:predicted nucleotidyltransferase
MTVESLKSQIVPILQKHQVVKAGVFGSFARNEATEESDVDLLIQFNPDLFVGMYAYMGLKFELEDVLKRQVDLVEYEAITPRLRMSILEDEIRFYG